MCERVGRQNIRTVWEILLFPRWIQSCVCKENKHRIWSWCGICTRNNSLKSEKTHNCCKDCSQGTEGKTHLWQQRVNGSHKLFLAVLTVQTVAFCCFPSWTRTTGAVVSKTILWQGSSTPSIWITSMKVFTKWLKCYTDWIDVRASYFED